MAGQHRAKHCDLCSETKVTHHVEEIWYDSQHHRHHEVVASWCQSCWISIRGNLWLTKSQRGV